jgi:hypothetical protein
MTKENREAKLQELINRPRMLGYDMQEHMQHRTGLVQMIREFYKPHFVMAEIGSYSGGSTEMFALFCAKVFAIDCWADNDNPGQDGVNTEDALNRLVAAEKVFDEKMAAYPHVIKVRKLSTVAFKDFADDSLDALYIDGNHEYKNVCKDIAYWYPKVKMGGIISGHDYYENIKLAVDNCLGVPAHQYPDASWLVVKGQGHKTEFLKEGWAP